MGSIDVVIPCFQYGRFLRDSVGSVLSQDVDALRVLIIDNASTDDSLDVARRLAAEDNASTSSPTNGIWDPSRAATRESIGPLLTTL
jgi:glycosyltransferase involved in cell wall biosynthesis